jgi:molybdate/tungstate transport system substrate-binding protein
MRDKSRRLLATSLAGTVGITVAVGLGASPAMAATPPAAGGDVDVLAAGSLNTLVTNQLAPAFKKATGYTIVGTFGGSGTMAKDIQDKVDVADVFLSASPVNTKTLMGAKNGDWVSWYANYSQSPQVLAYSPTSKFAHDLKTMPWWKVITMPGFRVGRTDPTEDPGGILAVNVLEAAAKKFNDPALKTLATEKSDELEETGEQASVQNGQLDGSFEYQADANSTKTPYVKLSGVPTQYAEYTASLVKNAPHETGALTFLAWLESPQAKKIMAADKFEPIDPAPITGSGLPYLLQNVFTS